MNGSKIFTADFSRSPMPGGHETIERGIARAGINPGKRNFHTVVPGDVVENMSSEDVLRDVDRKVAAARIKLEQEILMKAGLLEPKPMLPVTYLPESEPPTTTRGWTTKTLTIDEIKAMYETVSTPLDENGWFNQYWQDPYAAKTYWEERSSYKWSEDDIQRLREAEDNAKREAEEMRAAKDRREQEEKQAMQDNPLFGGW